jgi:hypothetical protein
MKLKVGDWVEVRSKEEILGSLDKMGRLEGLLFMPQMFQYCGQCFQVYKRAHKTCDWVYKTWGRRLANGVHLSLRCDGMSYDGCQNACLLFWKDAWLKPIKKPNSGDQLSRNDPSTLNSQSVNAPGCSEADVLTATRSRNGNSREEPIYVCQGTTVMDYTTLLPWWDVRQYLEDYTSGNVTLGKFCRGIIYASYYNLSNAGIGLGRPMRWFYDNFQKMVGGVPYPRHQGEIKKGQSTPTQDPLNLQPGEQVRVKAYQEILSTLNEENKNRGLYFDGECVPYCGGTYAVRSRVDKAIDEKTGKMVRMKDVPVILEGVWCQSRYSHCRMFCPRSHYPWWREIWLERVPKGKTVTEE